MEYTNNSRRASILLIEDDKTFSTIVNKHLSRKYDVTCTHDADSAVKQILGTQFDLVMMDIHIGGDVNGFDIIKRIRKMVNYEETPVIVTTGMAMQYDEQEYVGKGFTKLLAKPFSIYNLSNLLEELLNSKQEAGK